MCLVSFDAMSCSILTVVPVATNGFSEIRSLCRLIESVGNLGFCMNATSLQRPQNLLETRSTANPLHIRNARRSLFGEFLLFAFGFGVEMVFVILGTELAIVGDTIGAKLFGICGVVGAVSCFAWQVRCFPERLKFLRDRTPKLTLSRDAFSDHRTMVTVDLIDVDSIWFDHRERKETRADLFLVTNDGTKHVFDLRWLDMPSARIAWRVKQAAQIESAPGVVDPDGRQEFGVLSYALLAVMAMAAGWHIFNAI